MTPVTLAEVLAAPPRVEITTEGNSHIYKRMYFDDAVDTVLDLLRQKGQP